MRFFEQMKYLSSFLGLPDSAKSTIRENTNKSMCAYGLLTYGGCRMGEYLSSLAIETRDFLKRA